MHSLTRVRSPDLAIAALADRQHGVVARRQLSAVGLGSGAIQHRLSTGRLHRVFPGAFAVGRTGLTGHGIWMAAVLSCRDEALLSHRSAAALWGFAAHAGSSIDVTVSGARRRGPPGIRVHGGILDAEDRASFNGIPVTSVPRTLLELAAVVDSNRLERAVEEAERIELFDLGALERLCERSARRRGSKRLRAVLEGIRPVPETRSELERRFIAVCRRADLPAPSINSWVEGYEVDALWEEGRLVVELDGYAFHRTRGSFERDRARDAALLLTRDRVLRVTARRLADDPDSVVEMVRRLLASPSRELEFSNDMH
jgi:Protein of unknown function (DUF559)